MTDPPPEPVAPVFSPANYSWAVHDTVSVGHVVGTVKATDGNRDRITYALSGTSRFKIGRATGVIVVGVAPVSAGTSKFKVFATDSGGLADTAGVTIKVTTPPPTNRAPEIERTIPPQSVEAGRSKAVVVSPHFSDPDNDALTYSAESTDTDVATVSVSNDTVRILGVSKGSAEVTVTARDPSSAIVSQKFKVTVSDPPPPPPTNRAPEIESAVPAQTVETGGSKVVVVSSHFSDPDKDALTYLAGSSNRTVATVSVSNDTVLVRGVSKGSANVTVTARDPHDAEVSQRFRVTVKEGNAAPEVVSAIPAVTLRAGDSTAVDVSGHFRDPNGDALGYEAKSSNEAAATVKVSGSNVTVTGVFRGASQVTVTARDGRGGSVSQAFSVTVPNGAPVPVGTIGALTVAKGDTGSVSVSGRYTDPERDVLTFKATSSDSGVLAVEMDGDRLRYEALKVGTAKVTVTADDGHGGTAEQEFGVTVESENDPPVVESAIPALTVAAGETAVVDVSGHFSDPDDDALSYDAESSDDAVATVKVSGSEVTVAGVSRGEARVTVTARDGRGGSASQDFAVTVPNRAPEAVGSLDGVSLYKFAWARVEVSGAFSDPDGDDLTYRASSSVGGVVSVSMVESRLTLRGLSRDTATITVTADDGHGGTAAQTFAVEVPNRPPVRIYSIPDRTIAPGERFTVKLSDYFREIDGDTLTFTAVAFTPGVAAVSIDGGDLVVVGLARGRTEVSGRAHDGHGAWSGQPFQLTVTNGAPSFEADAYEREVAENSVGGTVVGDPVTATDADGDDVTYSFASGGSGIPFEIDAATGRITVSEDAVLDYEGEANSYTVQVAASDGRLADTASVTIQVTDIPPPGRPDAPVVTGGTEEVAVSWSAPENEGPEITGYDLRYRVQGDSDWTEVSALGVVLAHTVTGLDAGTTYQVQMRAKSSEGAGEWSESGEGTTKTANKAPAFDAETYEREVAENSAAGTAVGEPVTATDDDGDDLAYSFIPDGDGIPFEIDGASGRITVAEGAALDHEGEANSYAAQVVASDGMLADTATVTIRVTDIPPPGTPDAPVVTGGTEEVAVSWSAPENEGPEITGYDLRYRVQGDSDWTEVSALGGVLAHTVTGLNAGTTYQVQVRAESSEGAGEWSEPGEGTTETANRAPAFDADTYEREVAENSPAGTAVGDPVTATDGDGDDLTYSFIPGGSEIPFEIDAASGRITVAEGAALDHEGEANSYAAQVVANDGILADTTTVTIQVTDVPPPGTPDAPVVTSGTEEVAVSWSAPENEGPEITGYELRYQVQGDIDWTDVTALGVVLAHKITGLEAGTIYLVQVRARSSEGAGEWSDSGEGATAKANKAPAFEADGYEREVAENSVGGTAVGEPVTATDDDGDDLTYSFISGGDDVPFEIDAASGRITVAEGATLDHEGESNFYAAQVVASDGTLADTASVTILVTDVPAPGTPDAPVVTGGTEEASVTWSAPSNEGPEITGYDLRYRASGADAWTDPSMLGVVLAHTITGLEAGTAYLVQVRAKSSEGAGEWSESGEGTTEAANRAPAFDADAYEREVAENSPGGTEVGAPVAATDPDGTSPSHSFVSGGDEAPFEIDAATGRITLAEDAALNYESEDTLFTVRVEASDGELADTASVTIRVTNADDPGKVALSPEVARVGVEMTAMLMDEDGVLSAGRQRRWQRSRNGNSWNGIGTGRMYNPVTGDAGKWLRVVFTYADGHGPDKRAVSAAVKVLPANAAPTFGADAFERSVPENSEGGKKVGRPVTATDGDGDELVYGIVGGGDAAPFEIDAATGRITVAEDAALNYESADTLYVVRVEASDGELADTASVTIRVTDADDPGKVTLSPEVARVGVELTAMLMDEDGALVAGRQRKWQRSRTGNSWNDIAGGRRYTPVTTDEGRWLRAVFTYTDGHGPDKRAASVPVKVLAANAAPSFAAEYEREVPENSTGGTKVGAPVAATDPDNTLLSYSLAGGGEALFEIGESTGQITVSDGADLDYESGDTLYTVRVAASDGDLADTASVKIRVTNADDPGGIALSADVGRVGVRLTATLMDQDRSIERSKMRSWQRSPDGTQWTMIVQGAERRFYTPTEADRGKYLRAVFTYTDGHGPGKRAESAAIAVVGASTPVVSFGAESYTVAAGGSADVAVLLSPAASSALAVEVVAGDSTHTVTFQSGASSGSLAIGTAGLSASDTLDVRFGTLPEAVAVGVPATTRIVVTAVAGDRAARTLDEDGSPTELEVEYARAAYAAVAGGPGTEILLRVSPAADRRVAVPMTATGAVSVEPTLPDSVVFEPGDSVAAFRLDVPAGAASGLLALGFGALPEAVSAGAVASATVDIAAPDTGTLEDEAFDVGLAVFGRAVAEGAQQAIGARIDAVMRHAGSGSGTAAPGSAAEWAGRAAGTLASVAGLPLGASSPADMARRSGSLEMPTGREAVERLLPRVSFATALGPQTERGRPRIGLWAEGSTQSFRGEPGGIGYDGGLRALTVGADARIGSSALLGVSVMRSDGDLDYGHHSADRSLGHAMNSVHPYLFLQPSARIGLWAMAGYGGGDVRDDGRHDDAGASLRMLSGGVRVPLARSGAFGLALTGDAFGVGMNADDSEREGSATRARALLEASWATGGLKLATQVGARYDAGDADTGGGAETGASVGYAGHGLDLDLRGRLALGSGRHREWGAALRIAFDPGTRGEGFRLAISPRHGHDQSGIHGLLDGRTLHAMTLAGPDDRQWRLDAEAGYALKNPRSGGALDGYTRLSAGAGNRAWSLGTGYHVSQTMRLAIEGSRALSPDQPGSLGLRLALDYKF